MERGDSLESKGKEDAESFASQLEQLRAELEQLRAELAAEQEGRASDAAKAAADAEELKATIKHLQESASKATETHDSEQKDALTKIEKLTEQLSKSQAEHSAAVERGDSLEAKGREDAQNFSSQLGQLWQLCAEFAAEQDRWASDAAKAAAVAKELKATIQRLQTDLSDGDIARETLLKEAADKANNLSKQLDDTKLGINRESKVAASFGAFAAARGRL